MALSKDVIKANEALVSLTDDQLDAVVELSVNDEITVIGNKVGEIHGQYDKDILEVTGVAKNSNEKTYDYNKRVLGDLKSTGGDATKYKSKVTEHEKTIGELTQKIADGKGNEVMKKQLQDAKDELVTVKGQYDKDKTDWETERTSFATQTKAIKVNGAFDKAAASLKFKAEYPVNVQKTLLESTKSTILAKFKTDHIDDGEGGKKLVFRDKDDVIVRTKENALKPTTFAELIQANLGEVLDGGKKSFGGGSKPPNEKKDTDLIEDVDISSAKNQIQADDLIVKQLMAKGYVRGTPKFVEQQAKVRVENNVDKLPLK